jgi:hypothetical protein
MSLLSRLFPSKPAALLCPHCEREMDDGHDVERCARKRMSRRFFFGVMGGAAVATAMAPAITEVGWEAWTDGIHTFYRQQITFEMLKVLQTIHVRRPQQFTIAGRMI